MNRSGRLGSQWEQQCVDFLGSHGFPWAERRVPTGLHDKGDISGIHGVVIECKNTKVISLPQFLKEAEIERQNAGAKLGIVMVKQRSKSVEKGYFVVDIETGVRMLRVLLNGGEL